MAAAPSTTRSTTIDLTVQFSRAVTPSTISSNAIGGPTQFTTFAAPSLLEKSSVFVETTFLTTSSSATHRILSFISSAPDTIDTSSLLSPLDRTIVTNPKSSRDSSLSAPVTGGIEAVVTFAGIASIFSCVWLHRRRKRNAVNRGICEKDGKEWIEKYKGTHELSADSPLSELDSIPDVSELESIATSTERWSTAHGAHSFLPHDRTSLMGAIMSQDRHLETALCQQHIGIEPLETLLTATIRRMNEETNTFRR
jgi:hypothetical protein